MKNLDKLNMSHSRHRTFINKKCYVPFAPSYNLQETAPGPIFIDSSIVTEICYNISPLG